MDLSGGKTVNGANIQIMNRMNLRSEVDIHKGSYDRELAAEHRNDIEDGTYIIEIGNK